ncbi:MAG: hypothetical protein ACYCXZ_07945 [Coriobacteriia bacterium]
MGEKTTFQKNAKGVMRIMLGVSAVLASIGGLIGAGTYMMWYRKNHTHAMQ